MKLKEILAGCKVLSAFGNTDINIESIESDSRKVAKNTAFIAIKGFVTDGHNYIKQAIKNGASAIIYDNEEFVKDLKNDNDNQSEKNEENNVEVDNIAFVQIENTKQSIATIACNFYDDPSSKLTVVGITGTNGKTTTVTLLYNLFKNMGYQCGLLSTIANYVGDKKSEAVNTTADPITLYSLLNEMVVNGCEYCFMEVSSIGQEQGRVDGIHFKVAIFSNLTHDHLDYHKTFAEYLRCKKLFFDNLDKDAIAITNVDDKNGLVMVQNTKAQVVTYSLRGIADHNCKIIEESFEGMQLRIDDNETWTRLIGKHNAYNLLAIYTTAIELGANPTEALIALSALKSAPGRLETIMCPRNITVVIDYAHTPDALENVLQTLRDISYNKEIICLFGCGGDRDRTKRPEMAEIAEKYSDKIVVTSDNNRTEDPEIIFDDIKKGFSKDGIRKVLFINSRKEAIKTSLMIAKDGAAILLAGKGHETYQINGTSKVHFSEREIVEEINKENC